MMKWKFSFLRGSFGRRCYSIRNVAKAYGDNVLYEDMNFVLPPGGIIGVIGPNGAGKTTLFRMITGQENADKGVIRVGESVKLAYVDQNRPLDPDKTIWQEISGGEDFAADRPSGVNSRHTWRDLILVEQISRNWSAISPVVNGIVYIWQKF